MRTTWMRVKGTTCDNCRQPHVLCELSIPGTVSACQACTEGHRTAGDTSVVVWVLTPSHPPESRAAWTPHVGQDWDRSAYRRSLQGLQNASARTTHPNVMPCCGPTRFSRWPAGKRETTITRRMTVPPLGGGGGG